MRLYPAGFVLYPDQRGGQMTKQFHSSCRKRNSVSLQIIREKQHVNIPALFKTLPIDVECLETFLCATLTHSSGSCAQVRGGGWNAAHHERQPEGRGRLHVRSTNQPGQGQRHGAAHCAGCVTEVHCQIGSFRLIKNKTF